MEKQLQPKLRFPEFSGDYKVQLLKDIAKFSKGKNISKADIVEDGLIECIRYGELYTTYNEVINKVKSKTNIDQKQLIFSESNDIIIPASGESAVDIATASCVIRDGVALGGDLNIIKTPENGVYLSYYFNNKKKFDIARKSQGISVIHIYADHLKSLKLILPSLPEQQKIADYLTTIDKKIELLEEKKTELSRYKKAMMQKLFAQEIRFKDENGNDYPEWEEKRLGEIILIKGGYAFKSSEFKKIGVPIIRISNISNQTNYIDVNKLVYYDEILLNDFYKVYKNELLIALSGATTGKASIYNFDKYAYVNQRVGVFKNLGRCSYNYIIQFIFSPDFKNELSKMLVAGAQPNISTSDLESIQLILPTSQDEQQKIANFLSAIDDNITKVEEQMKETQNFKKAMLQELFV